VLKNVTVTMDEETLRWARHQAAEKGTSVSKFIGETLEQQRKRGSDAYWAAYEEWKKIKPVPMKGVLPIRREDIYDRGR
jgi:hypothetical protein